MAFWNDWLTRFRPPPRVQLPAPASRFADGRRADSYSLGASIVNPLTGMGGQLDKGTTSRPNPLVMPLTDQELEALYLHNGIARKLVDIFPRRATREGWTIPDIDPGDERRIGIKDVVREGMTWAQLYGGCAVLLVTEDDVPHDFASRAQAWLKQPLVPERVGRLHAIHAFDARSASPQTWDQDIRSPNYRMPLTWSIADEHISAEVHHSRIAFFRGARRPPGMRRNAFTSGWSQFPDQSYLQHLWDSIRAFCDTMNGGAALANELKHAVMKIADLQTAMSGENVEGFRQRMLLSQMSLSSLGIMLLGPNDEYEQRATPPSGFGELSEAAKSVLSAVSGIPQQELWGNTPSGLNTDGESGKEGFNATIADFQEDHRAAIEQIYRVLLSSQDGPCQGRPPEDWKLEFNPLGKPSELVQAQLRQMVAQTDGELIDAGIYTADYVRRHRYGADGWKFELPGLDDEEIEELAFEDQARKELQSIRDPMTQGGPGGIDGQVPAAPGGSAPTPPHGPPRPGPASDPRARGGRGAAPAGGVDGPGDDGQDPLGA